MKYYIYLYSLHDALSSYYCITALLHYCIPPVPLERHLGVAEAALARSTVAARRVGVSICTFVVVQVA